MVENDVMYRLTIHPIVPRKATLLAPYETYRGVLIGAAKIVKANAKYPTHPTKLLPFEILYIKSQIN